MVGSLAHRGPDDRGIWLEPSAKIGLGQTRLAIVDLSPGGHQPMVSADGRFVLAFNGEIYNHGELSLELKRAGCSFRSASDTEVLLEAIARWGPVETCERLIGMFAFAVWDRSSRRLWLGRDRLGKKPLYLCKDDKGAVAFGSELKPFWHIPGFRPRIDKLALREFFRYSYVPDHVSIFKGVDKVMPGTVVEIAGQNTVFVHAYWQLKDVVDRQSRRRILDIDDAEESLLSLLRDATRRRMLSDVPLGAFLSGGVDSSLVVSLMQEACMARVKTFSIGFHESAFDEAPVARATARHLGTEHTEFYVSQEDAQNAVPTLPEIFDEPFADASQIPTYLLARLARTKVTVALTGDGGDEAFGGYLRYRNPTGLIAALYQAPRPLRHAVAGAIARVPGSLWDGLALAIPASRRPRFVASKAAKLARTMFQDDVSERGKTFLSFWKPDEVLLNGAGPHASDPYVIPECLADSPSEIMQFWETQHYLSGDLLAKVDRATMAASLEARSPLLDHRIVELAWQLPPDMKASATVTKRILRRLLARYVPDDIVNLPKQGFSVPIGRWLRDGLRDWAESVLSYGRTSTADLLDWGTIDAVWSEHLSGRNGHAEKLWIVLMFCAWHEQWFGSVREDANPSLAYV
jgi:asparagine synthase (glutamine-hydrolysing)